MVKYLVDNLQVPQSSFVWCPVPVRAEPMADNKTADGRALNCRTEIQDTAETLAIRGL